MWRGPRQLSSAFFLTDTTPTHMCAHRGYLRPSWCPYVGFGLCSWKTESLGLLCDCAEWEGGTTMPSSFHFPNIIFKPFRLSLAQSSAMGTSGWVSWGLMLSCRQSLRNTSEQRECHWGADWIRALKHPTRGSLKHLTVEPAVTASSGGLLISDHCQPAAVRELG